jgi:predicted nucleic acid-binding protein
LRGAARTNLTDPQCSLLKGEVNLSELRSVLRRRPFRLRPALVEEIERELRDQTIVPRPLHPANLPVRDPADRWVLASAVAGRADLLVTGDKDLLDIADESSLPIVTPRECRTKLLTARERERE